MVAIFIACYPRPADGKYKFDMDYYVNVHMPMQLKYHAAYGMRSYHVIEPKPETQFGVCPFVVQTIEYWDSSEGFLKAFAEAGEELTADLKMYTDITNPFPIVGDITGSWTDSSFKWNEIQRKETLVELRA